MQLMEIATDEVLWGNIKSIRKQIDHEIQKVVLDVRLKIPSIDRRDRIDYLVSGRGLLGHWGPNHAGDPVVTRWAKDQKGNQAKVLEIILITRKDSGELALPGGMVDAGFVLL